jgi:hypothetical protein
MTTETTETVETAEPSPTPRKTGERKKSAARSRKATRKSATRKSSARKTAARKRSTGATTARRGRGGGSARLADSLVGLLTDVGTEVATVSALSAAIDDAARSLQAQLADFSDRVATLSRLRKSVSGGTLAAFLDETLVPERPAELEALTERIKAAQSASI